MAIYEDLDDRRNLTDQIEACRRDFAANGNPLHAWEAWSVIRHTQTSELHEALEMPPWLLEYLDRCSSNLIDGKTDHLGRELGFAGSLRVAREKWGGRHDNREHLALRIVDYMWSEGLTLNQAADRGELLFGASSRTVSRAVTEADKFAKQRMIDRLTESGKPPLPSTCRAYSQLCGSRANP